MTPSWNHPLRSWLAAPKAAKLGRRRLGLEALEAREVPAITVTGTPTVWQEPGPVAISNASNVITGSAAQSTQVGAVEAIAVDPFNPTRAVVGAVNGGLWVTEDITAANPVYTSTIDKQPSLAIASVNFSPVVPNLVYAGTGSYTAGGLGPNFAASVTDPGVGGAPVGVYRSADGGRTWTLVGANVFGPQGDQPGVRVRDVVPTRLNGGNTVFAATTDGGTGRQGIWRSDDRGNTWTRLSGANGLPDLGVTSLITDANASTNRLYAFAANRPGSGSSNVGAGAGVYALDLNGGNTQWVDITSNLPASVRTGARVVLASTAAGSGPVYAGVIAPGAFPGLGFLQGVYRAIPFGPPANPTYVWTAIGPGGLPPDLTPGEQAEIHFSIAADPTSDRLVYVGGDRVREPVTRPNGGGSFSGAAARGDAIANTWTTLTIQQNPPPAPRPGTVNPLDPSPEAQTAPHPDLRGFTFVGANTLLAATDGGVYRLLNPRSENGNPPVWQSINGNLKISETYEADLDNRNSPSTADDVLLAALQDNGSSEAVIAGTAGWAEILGGDGTIVRADEVNNTRYYSFQGFGLFRRDAGGPLLVPALNLVGTNTDLFSLGQPFKTAFELNQADPGLILVGGVRELYYSTDKAENFVSVGGVTGNAPNPVANVTATVVSLAYGTRQIRNAAYVGTEDGNVSQSFDVTAGGGSFRLTNFQSVSGGEQATDLQLDPENPLVAYAISNAGVFRTTDAQTFVDITGNLFDLVSQGGLLKLYSLALYAGDTTTLNDDVLFAGGFGGVYALRLSTLASGTPEWVKLGDNIPNVLVSDLRYDLTADTLVAGTYGRGVYTLPGASRALTNAPTVTVTGDAAANTIAVYSDPADATRYIVSDGLGNTQSFGVAAVRNVVLNGTGGADTLYVGTPGGGASGQTFPLGLRITANGGGQANDTLVVDDSRSAVGRQVTLTPTTIGAANGDDLFGPGGAITYGGFDNGSVSLRLGSGADQVVVEDATIPGGTTLTVSNTGVRRAAGGNYLLAGAEAVAVRGGAGNDTINVASTAFALTAAGGGGNDVFAVAGADGALGALGGPLAFDGGAGADTLAVAGTAAGDSVTARLLTRAGQVALDGLPQVFTAAGVEDVNFDGNAGTNSFAVADFSDAVFGSPASPLSGIVVAPSGVGAGTIRVGGAVRFGLANVTAGVSINGDANGNGDKDAVTVLGTSAPGARSAFGEAELGDGRDRVSVSEAGVSVGSTSSAGPLLAVSFAPLGSPSISFLYVATGNETGTAGDDITATPSFSLPIVIDGQGPSGTPGDRLTVQGSGTFVSAVNADPALGPPSTILTSTADQTSVGVVRIEGTSLPGAGVSSGLVVAGSDAGPESVVKVYDRLSGGLRFQVTPFPGFAGGVSVAGGDVTGDGIADVIVGAGPGGAPRVRVFNGLDGSQVYDIFGYESTFRGGVNVSAGDFNGDGFADIVLGTGVGGGPRVRIISGRDLTPIRDVFAYNRDFRGGVNVAVGDVTGDGTPDLVTSTGSGGSPRVVVLDGTNLSQIASFFVFDPNSRTGFTAAAGDVNGDGFADIIAGTGAGEQARVRVFSGLNRSVLADFYLNDPFNPGVPANASSAGVRVATADANGDGIDDVITSEGAGTAPVVRTFQLAGVNPTTNALFRTLGELRRQSVFDDGFNFGVFVGASD